MLSKVLKNSLFLYLRMFLLLVIGFFTSRKILEALGIVDLGVFNVVASFVVMFDFISSGLTNSTQRFLSFGLGKKDAFLTNQYFSQSLVLHFLCGFLICFFVECFGSWFVNNKLNIPYERTEAAFFVFHLSVGILFLKFIRICYESNVVARERMSMYAYLCVIEGVSKLLICFAVIEYNAWDKMKFYVLLLLILNFVITLFYVIYCNCSFPESKFKWYFEKTVYKQLMSFVGVNSFGVVSWALGKQGIDVVMNIFFGPAVNGAKSLASQLDRVISQFGSNVDVAVRPQIIKYAAVNEHDKMIQLAMKSTRYIFFVMLIVGSPFIFKTKVILNLWLGSVPEYTDVFVKILVFEEIFNTMGKPFNDVSMAIGKIKTIQVYGRLITLSVLPLSYVVLKYYPNPLLPVVMLVLTTFAYSSFILVNMNKHLHFGCKLVFVQILKPVCFVSLISFFVNALYCKFVNFDSSLLTILVDVPFLLISTLIVVVLLGLSSAERMLIFEFLKRKVR